MRSVLVIGVVLALAACGPDRGPFAELPPREVPDSIEALAVAPGWTVTDGGVLAEAGDTFTLTLPREDTPAEVVYHLDRIEPDGTLVETVEMVAISVPTGAHLTQALELPDESGAHYELFAEVSRDDGTFVVYRDWLYAP